MIYCTALHTRGWGIRFRSVTRYLVVQGEKLYHSASHPHCLVQLSISGVEQKIPIQPGSRLGMHSCSKMGTLTGGLRTEFGRMYMCTSLLYFVYL